MTKKRYSIVRVDGFCPLKLERKLNCDNRLCRDCKLIKTYGDTKEQMVMKVAQALLIDEIERYRKAPNCEINKTIIEHESRICLEKAQFIVEFLGVK